ncbi:hypothetical protein ABZ208_31035 [Streptomyces sp. NPDC006208]|uniref:hypothetical protein n=1 Tax=Streptomyces sp. NPDC006208 TaxID=3156734 RepID=UPI0033AEFBF7
MSQETKGGGGFLVAALGATVAVLAWAPPARISIDGGFEQQHRHLSVLYIDFPVIALGGALVPLAVGLLTLRWLQRPWVATLAAVAALALGVWGLTSWWAPYQQPEIVY